MTERLPGYAEGVVNEYTVEYYAGPYSGRMVVFAEDRDHAIAIVRKRVRKSMTLPMYADRYKAAPGRAADAEEA